MSSTSSNLPVCVYCGTPRPADETSCPQCGRPWIDVRIDEEGIDLPPPDVAQVEESEDATPAPPPPPVAGPTPGPPPPAAHDDTGEFEFDDWTMPPDRPRRRAIWLIPILLGIAVVVVWALVFLDGDGDTTDAADTTTTTTADTTTTTAAETTTTTPDTTTTTTEPATTTTIAIPAPSTWEPVGDPIDTADLGLRAEGIGPLDVGQPIADIAGRLTASLGEADASALDGACPPDESYSLQWGALRAFFDGFDESAVFVSYRYEDTGTGTSPDLSTLSGLALGDTVADLESIYSQFTITFEVIDGQDHFRLVDGADLLLWGPVSSTEPEGTIDGIYSPTPCETP